MPILTDGSTDHDAADENSGFQDFLKSFLPPDADTTKKQPSEGSEETTTEEQRDEQPDPKTEDPDEDQASEEEGKEGSTDEDTEDGDGKEPEKKYAEDGAYLKVKVGEKEHEVPLKDLGRLYGQEAALTQKGQQLAEQRKQVDTQVQKNAAVTDALLKRAQDRFEPYSKVDFNLAAQQLTPEEYTALRNEAMAAHADVQFLTQHADAYTQHIQQTQLATLRERASATLKELADPEKGIEGWNETMYNDMSKFATSKYGIPSEVVNTMVEPWAFRLINDAMAFHKAKDVNANVKVTKVNKTPKKVVKTTTPPAAARAQDGNKAMKRLQATGSTDDAAAAFLERWSDKD